MSASTRTVRAVFALSLATWSQACMAYGPPPSGASLGPGSGVRVRSAEPFALSPRASAPDPMTACYVTSVEGKLRRSDGDTLVLERVSFDMARGPDGSFRSCAAVGVARLVRAPASELTVRQFDVGRTALLLACGAAVVMLFAANFELNGGKPLITP